MGARQTHIRRERAPADPPAKASGSGGLPAPPILRMQRAAGNRAAATVARRALQRLDEADLEAIRKDKKQKQELERIQKKYNDNFVDGEHSKYHGAETWHYWVDNATSLADLDKRITDLIKAAVDYKARTPAPAKQPSQVPPTSSSGSSPNISSPVVPTLPPSSSSTAPAPQKKKRTKMVAFDPSAVQASTPTAWGPGMNPSSSVPSAYKPQPLTFIVDAKNYDVADLIKKRPPGAVRIVGEHWISEDTIYFPLTVTEAATTPPGYTQPIQNIWELEIHYHPSPTSTNWLHVKMRAATSAQNVLPKNNWLVDRAMFKTAVADWNSQKGTDKQSAHKW